MIELRGFFSPSRRAKPQTSVPSAKREKGFARKNAGRQRRTALARPGVGDVVDQALANTV
ncbi:MULTISPECIES: hypothetical protein [Paraburkholderia]|uniref:Uncharacterized protein n=1 Tax=Paraburkholderia podalyriae TaxID=1938811 RepID=A0ABR7PR04_9BURK|nr:hypothetical protein [Paraburkholderia podalyriae]MBC8748689.1 hypothetical protein [Paraburkholderia podalyriae]